MPAAFLHRFARCALLLLSVATAACGRHAEHHSQEDWRSSLGASAAPSAPAEPPRGETRDPVQLRALSLEDGQGEQRQVSCISCHSLAPLGTLRDQKLSVHGARTLTHGTLTCQSCHEPSHNDRLTLAGGESIAMTEALTLCAQCHGPQYRDYRRGSHGGMKGYWDRSVGPRERKHCVECHEPHSPAFRPLMPVLPPHGDAGKAH